jgi:glycosyltransferase involved in cell wall biosynthesis/predicted Zn-dependent protease
MVNSSIAVGAQFLDTTHVDSDSTPTRAADAVKRQVSGQSLLLARCRHVLAAGARDDPSLVGDLSRGLAKDPDNPALHTALGLATVGYGRYQGKGTAAAVRSALEEFQRSLSLDPSQAMARLNVVEALGHLGQKESAALEARLALVLLDRAVDEAFLADEGGHLPADQGEVRLDYQSYPPIDEFAAAWEQAGNCNGGWSQAEAAAKRGLIRWRLHQLLAQWTGATSHYFEAGLAFPESSTTRAALGCALARGGKVVEALPHLRLAVEANPLDVPAARNLYQALGEVGDAVGQRRVARDLWLLARMIPTLPTEPWFDQPPPVGDELASIIVVCDGQGDQTRACLESLVRHTHTPFEIVLVTDGESAELHDLLSTFGESRPEHPYLKGFQNITPQAREESDAESRRQVPFGSRHLQGLARAKGDYLVLLEANTVLTEHWLERMIACSLAEWPRVGMVGPVTNPVLRPGAVPDAANGKGDEPCHDPQIVDLRSDDPRIITDHVRKRLVQFKGKAYSMERLAGFCLLIRREVYEAVAPLLTANEFDSKDWCGHARAAGFDLMVALDVFVRHPQCNAAGLPRASSAEVSESVNAGTCGTSDRPRVSLCMIVKNEEGNLPNCLASVAGLTHETIIVDTGSTDRTRAIAEEAGARVFDFPWVDNFAAARNESLKHATCDWVFWMDADDRLDAENRRKLQQLFESLPSQENIAYVMKCLCLPDHDKQIATVVDHVRLFRNDPRIRWKYRVHEQILHAVCQTGGQARWSDVVIHHTGYQDNACLRPKLERALRLLQMDLADNPEEPFTLFNMGWTSLKLGQPAEAVSYLQHSLEQSQPGDSIVRKAFALLVESHKALGQMDQALDVCRKGRRACPDDAEMLFEEGCLSLDQANLPAAEACFVQLLEQMPATYFASVDPAINGYKARHCLGIVYHRQRRFAEAAGQWQAVLAERAEHLPTLVNWGELAIEQQQWDKLDELIGALDRIPGGEVESAILRAQGHMARKEYAAAMHLLEEAKARFPQSLALRVVLGHALLQEDRDMDRAEQALREVLAMDPHHQPTRHNLRVLINRKGSVPGQNASRQTSGHYPAGAEWAS